MKPSRVLTGLGAAACLAASLQAGAQNSSGGASAAVQAQQAERERLMIMQARKADAEARQKAQERCIAQRGTNCDTEEGLREWLLLDRTREQAVLDTLRPMSAEPFR